jgi:cytochrome b involved in lipid metabolism
LLVPGPPPLPLPGPLPVPGPPPLPLTPLPTAVGAPCTVTAYTQSELSKHNQSNDLWVAIQGSVYDLTSYAPTHPNGPQSILAVAGTDATGSFSQYHQPAMLEQAAPYKIGILSLFSGQVPCWN